MKGLEETLSFLKEKRIEYKEDVSMKNLTSFKIGGKVKIFASPNDVEGFRVLISFLKEKKIPYFFLGNGSNILFRDEDFFGVAVCSKNLNKIEILDECVLYCESGVKLLKLCSFLQINSFSGMEPLFGIPGSLGGAVLMNAGAYGAEIKDFVISVKYLDENGNLVEKETKDLDFSYRHSMFQERDYFIVSAKLKFKKGKREEIEKNMKEILKKGFAAKLIEDVGLKGFRVGDAIVSQKHSGFIVNGGNATAKDVEILIEKIRNIVKTKKNVDLEMEIKIIG